MPRNRRMCFNFEEIFNDHRKLCYLFVDTTKYSAVKDFRLHVQSGFNVHEKIYFADKDGVLFPDFDDIRILLDSTDIIWVRRLKDDSRSAPVQEKGHRSASTNLCNGEDYNIIPCSDDQINIPNEDSKSKKKEKKKKKCKKSKKDVSCENSFMNITGEDLNSSRLSLSKEDVSNCTLSEEDLNNCKSSFNFDTKQKSSASTVNSNSVCGTGNRSENETVEISGLKFNENCSVSDLKENSSSYQNKIGGNCSLNANNTVELVDGSILLENCLNQQSVGIDNLSDSVKSESKQSILDVSFCDKYKPRRKRVRRKKKDGQNNNNDNMYFVNDIAVKNEVKVYKERNSVSKHIRFDNSDDSEQSCSSSNQLSSVKISGQVSESSKLNGQCEETSLALCSESKCDENNSSNLSLELPVKYPSKIVGNIGSNIKYKNNTECNFNSEPNKVSQKNWDKKDESSEVFYDELLKLKTMRQCYSYFKSPVFTRTPKGNIKSKVVADENISVNDCSDENTAVQESSNLNISDCKTNISPAHNLSLKVDDIVNFKILFLSQDYVPTVSDNIVGRVISVSDEVLKFKVLLGEEICKPLTGKFALKECVENGENYNVIELQLKDLISPKKIINPFSMMNNENNVTT